jgi:zinc transport system permease protein
MPEIFEFEFMRRAMLAAVLVGAIAPAFGVFLVLRRLSLIADTLSHVALAGVAIGLLTKVYPPYIALGATSAAAVSIEELRARRLLPGDAALAVFLYGALALAVVIISVAGSFNSSLFSFLFGSILTVSVSDLWLIAGLTIAVTLFLVAFSSELAQVSFDSDLARINGVRVHAMNLALAVIAGATITVSMRVVGVLLIGALIVVPVLVALRLSSGLSRAVLTSAVAGVVMAFAGMVIAYYADIAPGGSVVLTGIGMLVLVEAWNLVRARTGHHPAETRPHTHAHMTHAHARGSLSLSESSDGTTEGARPAGPVLFPDDQPQP